MMTTTKPDARAHVCNDPDPERCTAPGLLGLAVTVADELSARAKRPRKKVSA
jgi:hypothetical protein